MGYTKQTTLRAMDILAERRKNSEQELTNRQHAIHEKYPEIKLLEQELSRTGMQLMTLIAQKPMSDVGLLIEDIKQNNLAKQQRIRDILIANRYPGDYLDLRYQCPVCQDTGYIIEKRCQCMIQLLKSLSIQALSENLSYAEIDFNTFNLELYGKQADESRVVPYDKMSDIYRQCVTFADSFSPHAGNLFLIGATGLGKTHLSLSIAKRVIEKGYSVIFISSQNLLNRIENEHFKNDRAEDTKELALDCDLLIIDDLGSEFLTQFSQTIIYNLINSRIIMKKPTIISSNYSIADIQSKYTQSVLSRIVGEFTVLKFVGRDIRLIKNQSMKMKV